MLGAWRQGMQCHGDYETVARCNRHVQMSTLDITDKCSRKLCTQVADWNSESARTVVDVPAPHVM